jgi:hypothetical protein
MDDSIVELGRDLGAPVISPVKYRIGRLTVENCGSGFLKIDLTVKQPEFCESELLGPDDAAGLINWITKKI